jgi:hypothetical protein
VAGLCAENNAPLMKLGEKGSQNERVIIFGGRIANSEFDAKYEHICFEIHALPGFEEPKPK